MSDRFDAYIRQALHYGSAWLIGGVLLASAFHLWRTAFAMNVLIGEGVFLFFGIFLARFMSRRSRDLEAQFFTLLVTIDQPSAEREVIDNTSVLLGVGILACAVFMPFFFR